MSRTKLIEEILMKRKPLAQNIMQTQSNLEKLSTTISDFNENKNELIDRITEMDIKECLSRVSLVDVESELRSVNIDLEKLKTRFLKHTLNIGVVGLARQGKSTLLQSISGLTSKEIPSGNRNHCTGTKSKIINNDGGNSEAEIMFYTKEEFLKNILYPYYNELKLWPIPSNLEDFEKSILPEINVDDLSEKALGKAKYEHLKKYKEHFLQYKHLIGNLNKIIDLQNIREFVAQDDENGERIYVNYMAVKEAKIYCNFPHKDVGKIALIDMPGLGDTGIGAQDRLISTVGQEVDIVVFVKMPKSTGDYWGEADIQLYDLVHGALSEYLPIKEWSIMVLNNNGQNTLNCNDLIRNIGESHMEVSKTIIANCSDKEDTEKTILDQILGYLVDDIHVMDKQYSEHCQERVYKLGLELERELEKAKDIFRKVNVSKDETDLFNKLFKSIYEKLVNDFENLLKVYFKKRNEPSDQFWDAINDVIELIKE